MITSIFRKSKPLSLGIVAIALFVLFLYANLPIADASTSTILNFVLRLCMALFLAGLLEFIILKNALTKNNSYGVLLLVLCIATFPETLTNTTVMLSCVLVCLALQRLLGLHTKRNLKKKFFDAAFWIALATMCYSWAVLCFVVVIFALLFHWQNDVKNIVVAVLGVLAAMLLAIVYTIIFYDSYIHVSAFNFRVSFDFSYFSSPSDIVVLCIIFSVYLWSLISVFSRVSSINKKQNSSLVLVMIFSFLAILICVISSEQQGSQLLFLFVPFSIITANYIARIRSNWFREFIVSLLLLAVVLRLFL